MSISGRIIRNTWFLYLRMGITFFISLYTTRIILSTLGASDFGIFNVIGGSIAMLGFLNSTMANATQRFMSYAEGEGFLDNKRRVFNVSLILHFIIGIATILLLIAVRPLLFDKVLNIAPERIFAAKIIYYSLIVSTFLSIINVPYDAVLNSHENMLLYSLVGIVESILRLIIALICVYSNYDKLIVYGILMACIPVLTLSFMKYYCHKHYSECILAPVRYWDQGLLHRIFAFSGWNFLTAISSLFTVQGIGIVLNHFFGTILNAAQGIANQVNGQLSAFSSNMMKAMNPVIVKKNASKDLQSMNRITIAGCKYSAYMTMLFAIPVMLEINFILRIWLKEVPDWTALYCILLLIYSIIIQTANAASTAVYASGRIKNYAIYKCIMNILPLIATYICFVIGGSPIWLYIPMVVFMGIGGNIVIVFYAHKECSMSISAYIKDVLIPVLSTAFCMIAFGIIPLLILPDNFLRLIVSSILTTLGMIFSFKVIGMTLEEKNIIRNIFNKLNSKFIGRFKS